MKNENIPALTLGQLVKIFGENVPVYFKVYSCGQSSSYELLASDVELADGKLFILSDLN